MFAASLPQAMCLSISAGIQAGIVNVVRWKFVGVQQTAQCCDAQRLYAMCQLLQPLVGDGVSCLPNCLCCGLGVYVGLGWPLDGVQGFLISGLLVLLILVVQRSPHV